LDPQLHGNLGKKQGNWQNEGRAFPQRAQLSMQNRTCSHPPRASASLSNADSAALFVILFSVVLVGLSNGKGQGTHQGNCCSSQWSRKEKDRISIAPLPFEAV